MAIERSEFPNSLHSAIFAMAEVLDQFQLRYALIGGLASGYRSRPRFTQDVDFLLEIPQLVLPSVLTQLETRGFEFDARTVIHEWTKEHFTAVFFQAIRVDWLKPVVPLYQHVIDLARLENWLGFSIRIASPEGIILTKLVAFRGQDQIDVHDLLIANRGQLDIGLIRREWQSIASLDAPQMKQFEDMVGRYYTPPAGIQPNETASQ